MKTMKKEMQLRFSLFGMFVLGSLHESLLDSGYYKWSVAVFPVAAVLFFTTLYSKRDENA